MELTQNCKPDITAVCGYYNTYIVIMNWSELHITAGTLLYLIILIYCHFIMHRLIYWLFQRLVVFKKYFHLVIVLHSIIKWLEYYNPELILYNKPTIQSQWRTLNLHQVILLHHKMSETVFFVCVFFLSFNTQAIKNSFFQQTQIYRVSKLRNNRFCAKYV